MASAFAFWWLALMCVPALAQTPAVKNDLLLLTVNGRVEVLSAGRANWVAAKAGQALHVGDRVRTGPNSRATVRLSNLCVLPISESMSYELQPPRKAGGRPVVDVSAGSAYFFSRDNPQEIQLRTPVATGAIRGTEFNVTVGADGRTELTLIDGEVELTTPEGSVVLTNGQQAVAEAGKAPVTTAVLNARNIIQWSLYYPAVLDPAELGLSQDEQSALEASLTAYRQGNLPQALQAYPAGRTAVSAAEKIYHAELLLSVGLVPQTEKQLESVGNATSEDGRKADAIRELIAAVKFTDWSGHPAPELASEWLAESYYRQSRSQLNEALAAARMAVKKSPSFAFGWERVAELEFGFGHTAAAQEALDKSLGLAPQNAEGVALKGFLLAAQNRITAALDYFDQAIALDGGLGNAWLGRGLCRIRRGDEDGGRGDLLVAAAQEPQRSVLRSYLGKAFGDAGEDRRAIRELGLARQLDQNDPTSWLYLAVLKQEENRINEAVDDLQSSEARNDNRSVFRSRLLLDKDRAVGDVNLASVYRDAGMTDVSVIEATRAVTEDYANASAHLFLSDSYNDLRDPTQFNLRYETVWFNELLLANTLAPIGGGRLSQEVSQQEYSRLFQADGPGIANTTDYRTDNMFHEQASQYGTFGNTEYSLDLDYHHNAGVRVNNDLDSTELDTTIKQQVTAADTALLLVQYQVYHSGDNFQYYDVNQARPTYRFDEYQEPILVGTWNHEWAPGIHTLAMFSRLVDTQYFAVKSNDLSSAQTILFQFPGGPYYATTRVPLDVNYHNDFTIYSAELNQIAEWERVTLSAGGRYQSGTFNTQDSFNNPGSLSFFFNNPTTGAPAPINDAVSASFERITGYAYLTVEPVERLWLTGGVAYDQVTYPDNFRQPPVNSGDDRRSQAGPKAAVVWNPIPELTLRGIYTRSLGGVSLDESYRLEPTQLAGFPQTFRSLISESIVGSVAAPSYETIGLALDLKLGTGTYAGLEAQRLRTTVQRNQGFLTVPNVAPAIAESTPELLDYQEYQLTAYVDQLLGEDFVIGGGYQLTQSKLHDDFQDVPIAGFDEHEFARLHHLTGFLLFNHPSGFFAKSQTDWYEQETSGWNPVEPGDEFFQQNFYAGYRAWHRRVQMTLGLLNVTGQDYKLNPLTVYQELPRKRVLEARLDFIF